MWIDGTHSAAEIASLSGKDAFNVYKLLHALALLGIVKGAGSAEIEQAPADDLAAAGVADASDAWAAPQPEPEPIAPPVRSAFDDEPEPLPPPSSTPAPPPIAPPRYEPEQSWGFDEAQIETARAATEEESMPASEIVAKAAKSNRWIALLFAAVVMIGLVFGGFAAWNWWQARNALPVAPKITALPVVRAKRPHFEPPVTATPPVTTTTAATAPAAMVVKPAATPPPAKPATAMTITPSTTQVTRNAEGTATITNTASAAGHPASNDQQRAHYDEMAKSFASQAATGAYTIQFELVCETASLTKAIRDGGSSVWFTPISYHSRQCYRVFWGHYPTKDEATRASREIPLALRGAAPVVVKVPTS